MPIYDFRCRERGKVSEIFLHGASQTARCPACGRVERCEIPPCSTEGICRRE